MDGVCELISKMQSVFQILRVLAFVGSGFYIAGWAWEYISKPKAGDDAIKDLKTKGTGLLIGFTLLFAIGVVLSFVLSAAGQEAIGCSAQLIGGW